MKYNITIRDQDHIDFQLFEASTNPLKIKDQRTEWISLMAWPIYFGIVGYVIDELFLVVIAALMLVYALVFGRSRLKSKYKERLVKYTKDYRIHVGDEMQSLELTDDVLLIESTSIDTSIKIREIMVVNEIGHLFLLKLSTGQTIIIPKAIPELNQEIYDLIRNHDILHNAQLDWKW